MTRFFDLIFSFAAFVVLIPFLAPLALLLSCTGEGKVFYRQERIGRGKKTFNLLKFATMLENSLNLLEGDITSGNELLEFCPQVNFTKNKNKRTHSIN